MPEGTTQFPTALDGTTELPEPLGTEAMNLAGKLHGPFHKAASLAIRALQAKVGINSSADTTSLDYKVANLAANNLWVGQPVAQQYVQWFTANQMRLVPFYNNGRITISKARIQVGTQAGNISVAVYNNAGTRVVTSGAIACPAAGIQDVALSSTTLTTGRYFIGLSCDSASLQVIQIIGYLAPGFALQATSHPCPATITPSASSQSGNCPTIILVP